MALNAMIVDELARAIVGVDDGILIKKIFHRDVASAITVSSTIIIAHALWRVILARHKHSSHSWILYILRPIPTWASVWAKP
jgi:hypothetical protein